MRGHSAGKLLLPNFGQSQRTPKIMVGINGNQGGTKKAPPAKGLGDFYGL